MATEVYRGNDPYQLAEEAAKDRAKVSSPKSVGVKQPKEKIPEASTSAWEAEKKLARNEVERKRRPVRRMVKLKHNSVRSRAIDVYGHVVCFDQKGEAKVDPGIVPDVRKWMRVFPGRLKILDTSSSHLSTTDREEIRSKAVASMKRSQSEAEVVPPKPEDVALRSALVEVDPPSSETKVVGKKSENSSLTDLQKKLEEAVQETQDVRTSPQASKPPEKKTSRKKASKKKTSRKKASKKSNPTKKEDKE